MEDVAPTGLDQAADDEKIKAMFKTKIKDDPQLELDSLDSQSGGGDDKYVDQLMFEFESSVQADFRESQQKPIFKHGIMQ